MFFLGGIALLVLLFVFSLCFYLFHPELGLSGLDYMWGNLEYLFGYKAPVVETPIVEVVLPEVEKVVAEVPTSAATHRATGLSYST